MNSPPELEKGRIAVLAFGTLGDVLPVAAAAAKLAKTTTDRTTTFITHAAHEFLRSLLALDGVRFHAISTPPVVLPQDFLESSDSDSQLPEFEDIRQDLKGSETTNVERRHREECLLAMEQAFDQQRDVSKNLIIFNFFALEGWHLAELFCVPCAIAAPYVVPYSPPASFEREFIAAQPVLYRRLQKSRVGEVAWDDVMHWMWPLFTNRWTEWRLHSLHLSAFPLTNLKQDPVTELPLSTGWPQAPLLLYGFSQEVVECPAYWPRNTHACGFWYPPSEWDATHGENQSSEGVTGADHTEHCTLVSSILQFLQGSNSGSPLFIGLSSIGSMGFFGKPEIFLKLLLEVLDNSNRWAILSTSSYQPLDAAVVAFGEDSMLSNSTPVSDGQRSFSDHLEMLQSGIVLGKSHRLFCFSSFVPYSWLFPKCSVIIHHGGSGTTAAALRSGVPQIICPFMLDQFYWAERMAWIGVATQPLKSSIIFPPGDEEGLANAVWRLSVAIADAIDPAVRDCAEAFSRKINREDGVGRFVSLICKEFQW